MKIENNAGLFGFNLREVGLNQFVWLHRPCMAYLRDNVELLELHLRENDRCLGLVFGTLCDDS